MAVEKSENHANKQQRQLNEKSPQSQISGSASNRVERTIRRKGGVLCAAVSKTVWAKGHCV